MNKKLLLILAVALAAALSLATIQASPVECKQGDCTTIQSGELYASTGEQLTTGFDMYGYNYQAHQYIVYYGNYQRPPQPVDWGYRLMMKWNDAWLSNKDCDGDGLLDRYYGYDSYIGSDAWLTNHMSGEYQQDGNTCKFDYFVKIIAAPEDAYEDSGYWYAADGTEIGAVIWGSFAVIQEIKTDPCAGLHGMQYISPDHPGFGGW